MYVYICCFKFLYPVGDENQTDMQPYGIQFRKKEIFYLTMHSTHFIYGYMASDMVKDHSDSERGNPLPPFGVLFQNRKTV